MQHQFSRSTAVYVVIASMIGSGVLTTSGFIATSLQSYGLMLLFWLVGGAIALFGSFALAEMATAYPRAGGDYNFVRAACGDRFAFVYGWAMVAIGYAAPVSLISHTIANFVTGGISDLQLWRAPLHPSSLLNQGLATLIIGFFTLSHCLGHTQSALVQSCSTIFKLLVFAAMGLGMFFSDSASIENLVRGFAPQGEPRGLGSSMILVMYAYTGWNAAVYLAGEMHEPRKSVPFALITGCLIVTAIYLAINVFYAVTLPLSELVHASADTKARVAIFASERAFGADAAKIISILLGLGMLSSVSAFTLTGPRIVYAMSLDGLSFEKLARLHPQRKVPTLAVLSQGLFSIVLLWSGTFEQILDLTGFGLGVMSLVSVAVIFKLRKTPGYEPTLLTPAYPWFPAVFCAVNAWMLLDSARHAPVNALLSLLILSIGFPLYSIHLRIKRL